VITRSDDNVERINSKVYDQLNSCLDHMYKAQEHLHDTGDLESLALDNAMGALKLAITRVELHMSGLYNG